MKTDNSSETIQLSRLVGRINFRQLAKLVFCFLLGAAGAVSVLRLYQIHSMTQDIWESQKLATESHVSQSEEYAESRTSLPVPNMPIMERPPLSLPLIGPSGAPHAGYLSFLDGTEAGLLIQEYGDIVRFADPYTADGTCDQWIYTPDLMAVYCLDDVPWGVDITDPKVPLVDHLPLYLQEASPV